MSRTTPPLTRQILVAALLVSLTGCPFHASVGLEPSKSVPVDVRLHGDWEGGTADDRGGILVLPWGEKEILVEVYDLVPGCEARKVTTRMRGYRVDVAGLPIVSLQDLEKPGSWVFYGYELLPDGSLSIRDVSDEVVKERPSDAAALEALLRRLKDKPGFFGTPMTLRRPAKAPSAN